MHINLKLCFRNIYINGIENFSKKNPIVLASNHPNSFLDGMIMNIVLPKPLNILIRGDAMKSKISSFILKYIYLIPIHRLSEGKVDLIKNDITFKTCEKELLKNKSLMIFSEGICVHEKKLRPLKKGTARIILPFLDKYPEKKLQVLPLGLNYSHFYSKKPDLMIQIGNPLELNAVAEEFKTNQAKSIISFNEILSDNLKPLIVHFDDKKDEMNFDNHILPQFKTHFLKTYITDFSIFNDIQNYLKKTNQKINYSTKKYNFFLYILSLLVVKISDVIYLPIKSIINYIALKKVKNIVFKNSVIIGLNMILGFFYLLFINIVIGVVFGFKFFIVGVISTYVFLHLLALLQNYVINYQKNKL